MKKIIAVNAGPRKNWNTAQLIGAACEGARSAGAETELFDLYELEKFTGCISCFGCKTQEHLGQCVCRDGLTPVLEAIREADGLIIGSPVYLDEATAVFRALFERLIFQYISYKKEFRSYNERQIPVLLILTSNIPETEYEASGRYEQLVRRYEQRFGTFIGPVKTLIAGDTKQVSDYSPYGWTMFDPAHKFRRHELVFPKKLEQAGLLGAEMAG